ncbi:hypothetical protein KZZ52_42840 [Dactylosporangium sp. AC04546]|uniref:hypothetical protein n=1 Tax=Dactylosporangium sp. AC04546 TaxID=2862460 RepID=UPI002E7BECD4|nr:hypothetical protein [Dactylosporangium sp. AC04546]WVK80651.1 hypothetical protein KZZ52_42840 [Dactylosporangium sp. AC04546]
MLVAASRTRNEDLTSEAFPPDNVPAGRHRPGVARWRPEPRVALSPAPDDAAPQFAAEGPPENADPAPPEQPAPPPHGRGRRPLVLAAIAGIMVVVVGGLLYPSFGIGEDEPTPTVAAPELPTEESLARAGDPTLAPSPTPTSVPTPTPKPPTTAPPPLPQPSTKVTTTTKIATTPASGPTRMCVTSNCEAWAEFDKSSDTLEVCDNKADGLAALVQYSVAGGADVWMWASGGAGTCNWKDLNLASGTTVAYRVCSGDQSEQRVDRCGARTTNYA